MRGDAVDRRRRRCDGTEQLKILSYCAVAGALRPTSICGADGCSGVRLHAATGTVFAFAAACHAILDTGSRRDEGREQELHREKRGETAAEETHEVRSTQIFCAALAPNCTGSPPTRNEKVSS